MSTREDPGLSQTTYVCHAENAMMLTMLTFQQPQRGHYFPRWDLGGQPEFDGVRSLVAAGYAYQLMTQALNYRYKICTVDMLCMIYIYIWCMFIYMYTYIWLCTSIYIQYRERGRMYDIYKSRKKSWAPKIMVPHLCWRRVWWYVNGASCKLPLVCVVE